MSNFADDAASWKEAAEYDKEVVRTYIEADFEESDAVKLCAARMTFGALQSIGLSIARAASEPKEDDDG